MSLYWGGFSMYIENPCSHCKHGYGMHWEKTYKNYAGEDYTMRGCSEPLGYYGDEPCMCSGFLKSPPKKARFDLNGLILE